MFVWSRLCKWWIPALWLLVSPYRILLFDVFIFSSSVAAIIGSQITILLLPLKFVHRLNTLISNNRIIQRQFELRALKIISDHQDSPDWNIKGRRLTKSFFGRVDLRGATNLDKKTITSATVRTMDKSISPTVFRCGWRPASQCQIVSRWINLEATRI